MKNKIYKSIVLFSLFTFSISWAQFLPTPQPIVNEVDFNMPYTSKYSGVATVKAENMGSIFTTFTTLEKYDNAISTVPMKYTRWPGGTLAETDLQKYSLTYDDIYNNFEASKGLTSVLAYANAKNQAFSMVIPTRRYMNNPDQGSVELKAFLVKLLNGGFGPVPANFILEIGNESAHFGWANGVFTPGLGSYGFVTNNLLNTMRITLADPVINPKKIDIKVFISLGVNSGGQKPIFSQISAANLKTVDGFVRHTGLVWSADKYNLANEDLKLNIAKKYWDTAWGGQAPDFNIADTAWSVGSSQDIAEVQDPSALDVGARQSGAVVKVFSQMIAGGSDYAAMWGVQDKISSLFFHKGETITHGGYAFKLIADSLVGATLLSGKVDTTTGLWKQTNPAYDIVSYKKGLNQAVVFISAYDIPDTGLDVALNLKNFGNIKTAVAESVKTINPGNRINEVATTSIRAVGVVGSKINYRLTQDYELVRITITK